MSLTQGSVRSQLFGLWLPMIAGILAVRAIGDEADAMQRQSIVAGSIGLLLLVAVSLSLLGFLGIRPLPSLMGAESTILRDATSYMQVWFAGVAFLTLPIVVNVLLRSTGDGLSPALLNIALNPLFIFGAGTILGLGMRRVAVATLGSAQVAAFGISGRSSPPPLSRWPGRASSRSSRRTPRSRRRSRPASRSFLSAMPASASRSPSVQP